MTREEVEEIRKEWKGSYWEVVVNFICAISYTKDPLAITRIVDILQKCDLSGKEEVMLLKGRTILF